MSDTGHDQSIIDSHPTQWDEEAFRRNWSEFLHMLVKENESALPFKRIQYQVEQSPIFQEVLVRWSGMSGAERLGAWKRLLQAAEEVSREVLPACVQCGTCCRKGSPTLQLEDLELLQTGRIQWNQLVTLRRGEPVKSPFDQKPFFLLDERIKIRERDNSEECIFFNDETSLCGMYSDRPIQCRAQACWDPAPAQDISKQPYLTRRDIFKSVDLLLEIILEHDQRCAFQKLNEAFTRLLETKGETIEEVLQILSYEDHFRSFVCEKLNVPSDQAELVFGRSFADLVPLFGFKVLDEPDGSRCLVPETD
jgi:Fe-S-cluster containining protein